jgi:hypothetical protein
MCWEGLSGRETLRFRGTCLSLSRGERSSPGCVKRLVPTRAKSRRSLDEVCPSKIQGGPYCKGPQG